MQRVTTILRRHATELLASVAVVVVTTWVFLPVTHFEFVMWDDDIQVYGNPHIRHLDGAGLRWMFTDVNHALRYTPLSYLNWSILYQVFGLNPAAYHLEALVLHVGNALLVFALLRVLLVAAAEGQPHTAPTALSASAGLGALLWAVHPLRAEVAAWVTQGRFAQALFLFLVALLCYTRAARRQPASAFTTVAYWTSAVAATASLLIYPLGAAIALILIGLDFYPLRRVEPAHWWTPSARARWLEKLPFVAAAAAAVGVTMWGRLHATGFWPRPVGLNEFGLFPRLMQAFYVWAYYVWRPWVPVHLSPVYTHLLEVSPLSPRFLLSACVVLGISVVGWRLRRRIPGLLVVWVCYLGVMVPVLGLTEHPHYANDRYAYLPGIGYSVLLAGLLLPRLREPRVGRRLAALGVVGVLLVPLGLLARAQTTIWRDSVALFTHVLRELDDDTYRARLRWRLCSAYRGRGQNDEAMACFDRILVDQPSHYDALVLKAILYLDRGDLSAAEELLSRASLDRPNPSVHYLLGDVYRRQQRLAEAERALTASVQLDPQNARAREALGRVLAALGRRDDALAQLREAVRIDPHLTSAHEGLARIEGETAP